MSYDRGMSEPPRLRWAWWLLAYASLGVGIIGIFLPLLPTTVFVLIAAYAASRGSRRLHDYLLRHAVFGPMILQWQQDGAVSRASKWTASFTMLLCAVVILLVMHWAGDHQWWMSALPIACMAVVLTWLWLRPEPPRGC